MKLRLAAVCLTLLCVAFSASAFAGTIFNDGAIDGNANSFFITGPNLANISGTFQYISNGFTAAISATPTTLQFGLWIGSGIAPTTVDYEIGTFAFGTDLGFGTVALNSTNSTLLFTNVIGIGYDVYSVTIPVTSLAMTAGDTYWLTLRNANDASNSGTEAWDIPNGGLGGPATCQYRQTAAIVRDCVPDGGAGESFVLSSGGTTVPEPGSIMLLGTGLLGVAGVIRRKLSL